MQLNSVDQFLPQGRTNIQVNGDKPQVKNPTNRTRAAAHGGLWLWAPGGLGGFAQPCEEKSDPSGQVPWSGCWPWGFSPTFHSGPLYSLFTAYLAFISSEKDEPGYKGDETWFSF